MGGEELALMATSNGENIMPAQKRREMRTTLALDDDLPEKAQAYIGLREKSALVREALRALIEREARAGGRGWVGASLIWTPSRDVGRNPIDPGRQSV
jgi:Arc/MetJ family transcription regulator